MPLSVLNYNSQSYHHAMQKILPTPEIVLDPEYQIRAELDPETVKEYAEAYASKAKFPPIDVFLIREQYVCADGWHRVAGARDAGIERLFCQVHKGGREECLKFALSANLTHGLRRTNADKRHAVEVALKTWPRLSNREIALTCGVSHELVNNIREPADKENSKNGEDVCGNGCHPPSDRICTDGSTQDVSDRAKTKEEREEEAIADVEAARSTPEPDEPPTAEALARADIAAAQDAEEAADVKRDLRDKIGWPLPASLVVIYNRRREMLKLLGTMSEVRQVIKKAQDSGDPLFKPLRPSAWLADFNNTWYKLKMAIPFAVCPTCQGKMPDACTDCHGLGIMSEWEYNCVRKDVRKHREKVAKNQPLEK